MPETKIKKPLLLDETGQRIAEAIEALERPFYNLTIIVTADDDADIVDQRIDIINLSTGEIYGTYLYNSPDALVISVPYGLSYRVKPIVTLEDHYCAEQPTGYVDNDRTISLTYKSLGNIEDFIDLKYLVDQGMAKFVSLGKQVKFPHPEYGNIMFEVATYNPEEEELTLLAKNIIANMQLDAPEALLKATSALSAGNYTFKNGSTSYYFTLTKELPVGGQLVANNTTFSTYETTVSTTPLETGTVSTTAITGATDLGTCGSGVLNHYDRIMYGSNDYMEANLRQYITSSLAKGLYYTPKTMFDRPASYFDTKNGFLYGVSQEVLDCIETTEVKCIANNVYSAPDSLHAKGERYTVRDKFFLASEKEIFGSGSDDGSVIYQLFIDAEDVDRIKYNGSSAGAWWLRSPFASFSNSERRVDGTGAVSYATAVYSHGLVLACKIKKSATN